MGRGGRIKRPFINSGALGPGVWRSHSQPPLSLDFLGWIICSSCSPVPRDLNAGIWGFLACDPGELEVGVQELQVLGDAARGKGLRWPRHQQKHMPLPWDRAHGARHTVAAAKVHDLVPAPLPTSSLIGGVCSGWQMIIPGGQEQLRGNDYSGCGVPGGARTPGPGSPASGRVCMSPPPAALRCCRWGGALQPTAWAVPTSQHPGLAGHGSTLHGQPACKVARTRSATIQKGL